MKQKEINKSQYADEFECYEQLSLTELLQALPERFSDIWERVQCGK